MPILGNKTGGVLRYNMKKIIWNAYKNFSCIAEKCEDACCYGWEVDIDEASAQKYLAMEGALGDRLRQVLKTKDGETSMVLENGRCPMWQQDGLCRLQKEQGHDALCKVCREFPRLYMDYGDFAEWGLEMSCPEAARLIFADPSVQTEEHAGTEPEYDRELMETLQKSRAEILDFWTNTEMTVPQALAVTLLYAHYIQDALDGGSYTVLEPEACLQNARQFAGSGDVGVIISFFKNLEILTDLWKQRLNAPDPSAWDERLKTVVLYLIRRYWLQAVWDFDLVCRAKLIVTACILINALGGDTVETAQQFSKEIENDPDNVDALLDAAYTSPAFTDANLLGLLLG